MFNRSQRTARSSAIRYETGYRSAVRAPQRVRKSRSTASEVVAEVTDFRLTVTMWLK